MTDLSPETQALQDETTAKLRALGGHHVALAAFMDTQISAEYRKVMGELWGSETTPREMLHGWLEFIGATTGQMIALVTQSGTPDSRQRVIDGAALALRDIMAQSVAFHVGPLKEARDARRNSEG